MAGGHLLDELLQEARQNPSPNPSPHLAQDLGTAHVVLARERRHLVVVLCGEREG